MSVCQQKNNSALGFSSLWLDVGGGNVSDENGEINLTEELCELVPSLEELIKNV